MAQSDGARTQRNADMPFGFGAAVAVVGVPFGAHDRCAAAVVREREVGRRLDQGGRVDM